MQSSPRVIKARQSLNPTGSAPIKTQLRFDELLEKSEQITAHDLYKKQLEQLMKDADVEKEYLLQSARQEAELLREAAQTEGYEDGVRKGMQEGYQDGYQKALAEAEQETSQLKKNAQHMLAEATAVVEAYYAEKRTEIIELAAQMAEQIVHDKIDSSDEKLLPLINPVLTRMEQQNTFVTLTVSPELAQGAKERVKELESNYPLFRFAVFSDASLEKNGCVIESPHAIADLQIKQQLDAMVKDLKELHHV